MENMKLCPKCGKEYSEHSALSRDDNKTEICPDCGILEALAAAGLPVEKQQEILQQIRQQRARQLFRLQYTFKSSLRPS